jgi:FkbM family methyltransferase
MFLPADWRGAGKLIFAFRECYEPELKCLERVLSPGKTFIDAGANYGIYTLVASKLVGETGRVIAFEPSVQSYPVLRKNIALNGLTNVVPVPVALSQKTGRTTLHRGPNPSLNSLAKDPSWEEDSEEVVTESLDNLLNRGVFNHVDVIKMDVQGAEELVLRGASTVVSSMRPVIIFEIGADGTDLLGLSPKGAWDLLNRLGYEFFVAGQGGSLGQVKLPPTARNVVAIYNERKGRPWIPGEAARPGAHEKTVSRDLR